MSFALLQHFTCRTAVGVIEPWTGGGARRTAAGPGPVKVIVRQLDVAAQAALKGAVQAGSCSITADINILGFSGIPK